MRHLHSSIVLQSSHTFMCNMTPWKKLTHVKHSDDLDCEFIARPCNAQFLHFPSCWKCVNFFTLRDLNNITLWWDYDIVINRDNMSCYGLNKPGSHIMMMQTLNFYILYHLKNVSNLSLYMPLTTQCNKAIPTLS